MVHCAAVNCNNNTYKKGQNSGVWWPIVANFNLNHRCNFKFQINFLFGMNIKSS